MAKVFQVASETPEQFLPAFHERFMEAKQGITSGHDSPPFLQEEKNHSTRQCNKRAAPLSESALDCTSILTSNSLRRYGRFAHKSPVSASYNKDDELAGFGTPIWQN